MCNKSQREYDHAYNSAHVFLRATDEGPVTEALMIKRAMWLARRQGPIEGVDPVGNALTDLLGDFAATAGRARY